MNFFTSSVYIALLVGKVYAKKPNQPSIEVVIDPTTNNIEIDIHVELAALQSDYAQNNTNSTTFNQTMTNSACHNERLTTAYETPTLPIVVTTKGFFLNSTSFPTATARFPSPSLIDLAAFSSGASARGPLAFSIVIAIASIIAV